jgi:hypothetical protein
VDAHDNQVTGIFRVPKQRDLRIPLSPLNERETVEFNTGCISEVIGISEVTCIAKVTEEPPLHDVAPEGDRK